MASFCSQKVPLSKYAFLHPWFCPCNLCENESDRAREKARVRERRRETSLSCYLTMLFYQWVHVRGTLVWSCYLIMLLALLLDMLHGHWTLIPRALGLMAWRINPILVDWWSLREGLCMAHLVLILWRFGSDLSKLVVGLLFLRYKSGFARLFDNALVKSCWI